MKKDNSSDIMALRNILEMNENTISSFNDIRFTLNKYDLINILLPNIGITYNNKVIELYHNFKNKNISIFDYKIIEVVLTYFELLKEASRNVLSIFLNNIYNNLGIKKILFKKDPLDNASAVYLLAYLELDKLIFNFDIKEDIIEAVKLDILKSKENNEYEIDFNEIIDEYNDELKELGIDVLIPNYESFKNEEVKIKVKI